MPIKRCQEGGRPGYKFGDSGKCYSYRKGDMKGEKEAYDRAAAQGRAIEVSKGSQGA